MPHDFPILPEFTSWPTFPFEGDLRVRTVDPAASEEPPRQGEDPATCAACLTPDSAYLWVSARWRVRSLDRPTGLPMVLILESRSHLDLGDLPNLLAAELGVMTVRLERAVRSLDGVARVHVNRWGDGSAHLHLWFLARPFGQLQLRGTFLSLWDDILPPVPEAKWRENLAYVGAWLAEFGGRTMVEAPHIDWQAPSSIDGPDPEDDQDDESDYSLVDGAEAVRPTLQAVEAPPEEIANAYAAGAIRNEGGSDGVQAAEQSLAESDLASPASGGAGESAGTDAISSNVGSFTWDAEAGRYIDSAGSGANTDSANLDVANLQRPGRSATDGSTTLAATGEPSPDVADEAAAPAKKATKKAAAPRKAASPRKAAAPRKTAKKAAEARALAAASEGEPATDASPSATLDAPAGSAAYDSEAPDVAMVAGVPDPASARAAVRQAASPEASPSSGSLPVEPADAESLDPNEATVIVPLLRPDPGDPDEQWLDDDRTMRLPSRDAGHANHTH